MSNELLFKTNEMHEHLNDLLLKFPIRWNKNHLRWEHCKELEARYCTVFTLTAALLLLVYLHLFYCHLNHPVLFNFQELLVVILLTAGIHGILALQIFTILQRDRLVRVLNIFNELNSDARYIHEVIGDPIKTSQHNSFLFQDRSDPVGFATLAGAISFTLATQIFAFLIVLLGQDPFHQTAKSWGLTHLISGWPQKLLLWFFQVNLYNIILFPVRYTVLFFMYVGMTMHYMTSLMSKTRVVIRPISIRFYNQFCVCINDATPVLGTVFSVILLTHFSMMVIGSTGVILGYTLQDLPFAGVAGLVATVSFAAMQLTFLFCCKVHENSLCILKRWTDESGLVENSQCLTRMVRSLKPVSVPAGHFKIFDKGIKMKYYNSVVIYATNVLVTSKRLAGKIF